MFKVGLRYTEGALSEVGFRSTRNVEIKVLSSDFQVCIQGVFQVDLRSNWGVLFGWV